MLSMDTIAEIRRRHLVSGESISAIARSFTKLGAIHQVELRALTSASISLIINFDLSGSMVYRYGLLLADAGTAAFGHRHSKSLRR